MKKTGNIRSFLCGVLACALVLGMVVPAVASTTVEKKLTYNDITIRLNGKVIIPKDANGNTVEPFIIDGTTYLPVRAVGEALGLNVSWDGKTRTVILGNDPVKGQPAAWLGEMDTFTGSATEVKTQKDGQYDRYTTANNGDTFDRYYYPSSSTGTTYLLRYEYTRLTGTLYISEYMKTDASLSRIQIFLDDKLAYTSPEVGPGIEPVAIQADLSGAYKMEIVTQRGRKDSDGNITWVNDSYRGSTGGWFNAQLADAALWTD